MSTSSVFENGSTSDRDSVFIERVKTYSPITKTMQFLDSPVSRSPAPQSPGYQSLVWTPESQVIQEVQSPGPYTQETIRRYVVQNQEQEVQSPGPYTQETIRRYVVQNPEQEIQSPGPYTQETIRRYIVQNPEQEIQPSYGTIRQYIVQNPQQEVQQYPQETVRRYIVQNPDQNYLKGVNCLQGNNVLYEKTVRRVDMGIPEDRQTIVRQSVSSQSDQTIDRTNQSKVSFQTTEDVVSEQKVTVQNTQQVQKKSSSLSGPEQLDARYFGELLAELSRKNTDLYSCLLQHVEKIGARKPSDSEYQDIESLIPKGVSELTKQQIRYLLQMRETSDKSMRLVLSTFSSLREDLGRMQNDLNMLESGKKSLERDLSFKDDQIREYEAMLASLREKNRQQQQELKDGQQKLRGLEETILSHRNAETDREYRLKELEYTKNTLQQENQNLRVQVSETISNPMLQAKTDEISRQYKEMIESLREEKDKEIRSLRTQISRFQHDMTARESGSSDLQMRLLELTSSLEQRDSMIKRQQEELLRLRQSRESKGVTQEIITRKYSTQYPILRLLNDYKETPGYSGSQTFVLQKREQSWK